MSIFLAIVGVICMLLVAFSFVAAETDRHERQAGGAPIAAAMLAAMKRARLIRTETGDQRTLGAFAADGLARGLHVLKLPWRGNARNRSCIPPGRYRVVPHLSPRFRRCLLATGVPGRSHILFHAGNFAGDAARGWRSSQKA